MFRSLVKISLVSLISLVSFVSFVASAAEKNEVLSLTNVWKQIHSVSVGEKAAELQVQAADEAASRSKLHWLPKLYIDAKAFQTNDPGASFVGLLEQKSVQQADFNPDLLNHPEQHTYVRGALGIDLPLYEGGMKSSMVDLQSHLQTSQEKNYLAVQNKIYSEVSKSYGTIAILSAQKQKISELSNTIEKLLKSYQLGNKGNPVGYSGLLGLKSLAIRLQGLSKQYQAESQAYYLGLKELGLNSVTWRPEFTTSTDFVKKYLEVLSTSDSYQVQAQKENASVAQFAAEAEKARYLPRVGAFAESYLFNGSRDTANGYMAGVYLQWNLFNPSDFGIAKEARLKSMAAEKYSEALSQQEKAELKGLEQQINALKENIVLLNEGQKLLDEQTKVTETLFKNGSINALQFVEVLSRRTDLIVSLTEAEKQLIQSSAERILKTHFEVQYAK